MGDPRHDYSPSLGQMADKPLFGVSKWRVCLWCILLYIIYKFLYNFILKYVYIIEIAKYNFFLIIIIIIGRIYI